MEFRSFVWIPILLVSALSNGCQPAENTGAEDPDATDITLRRGNGGEPGSLDPALAEDIHAFNILLDLYEGLVTVDGGGRIIPGVAESWTVSPEHREYRFKLRRDARWSNGDPVLAGDFVRAFRHAVRSETAASYAFLLSDIAGFDAVMAAEATPDALGIEAIDAQTLLIRLDTPAPHFLSILTMPIASPRHADAATGLVSNGPYRLESRQPMGLIRLIRNEHFHAADTIAVERVEYFPIVDAYSELNRFRAGELDITHTIPPNQLTALTGQYGNAVRIAPSLALYYIAFDLGEAPLDNADLRKALSLAIDRRSLVDVIGRGELPAFGIVPPGVAGYEGARYEWADIDDAERVRLARESFRKAGYGQDEPLTLTFLYDAGDIHETIALALADMWRDVLGIDVTFDKREWMFFLAAREDRSEWEVMRFSWFGDYDDASTFTDIFRSDNIQNLPGYRSREYDRLTAEAAAATDPDARARKLELAERRLLDDYAIAPLYFYVSKHLVADHVSGFEDNVLDRHPTRFMSIDTEPRR
ncbi:MAG: peptide ABC transporter substrate-binding protein [Woeseiaceae bacterium]|jgi:oligopeptide transport system substrate-binding protein|nr:peptide ABC transporter substrate-binding protein [Woeseiaceae bacterium]